MNKCIRCFRNLSNMSLDSLTISSFISWNIWPIDSPGVTYLYFYFIFHSYNVKNIKKTSLSFFLLHLHLLLQRLTLTKKMDQFYYKIMRCPKCSIPQYQIHVLFNLNPMPNRDWKDDTTISEGFNHARRNITYITWNYNFVDTTRKNKTDETLILFNFIIYYF